jgi:ABC-type transport system involved in cytochrome c biogenesis permease component
MEVALSDYGSAQKNVTIDYLFLSACSLNVVIGKKVTAHWYIIFSNQLRLQKRRVFKQI